MKNKLILSGLVALSLGCGTMKGGGIPQMTEVITEKEFSETMNKYGERALKKSEYSEAFMYFQSAGNIDRMQGTVESAENDFIFRTEYSGYLKRMKNMLEF